MRHITRGEDKLIKYDNSVCVRINDTLKNTISQICNEATINEADWIRARLANCAIHDVENLSQVKQEFLYG